MNQATPSATHVSADIMTPAATPAVTLVATRVATVTAPTATPEATSAVTQESDKTDTGRSHSRKITPPKENKARSGSVRKNNISRDNTDIRKLTLIEKVKRKQPSSSPNEKDKDTAKLHIARIIQALYSIFHYFGFLL